MTIVVLNNFPLRSHPYHEWLGADAQRTVLITGTDHNSESEIAAAAPNYASLIPVPRYAASGNVERIVMELHRESPLARVVATSEIDVCRAARLRDRLGIGSGQTLASARHYRDKWLMKKALQAGDVPVPDGRLVHDAIDIIDFAEHGCPLVIKRRFGMGSAGVHVVRSPIELESALATCLPGLDSDPELLCEEFIDGQMYHVDGLLSARGIDHVSVSAYSTPCPSFLRGQPLGSVLIDAHEPVRARLEALVRDAIAALPSVGPFAFHCEVFHTADDALHICEIASRAGGRPVAQALRAIRGVDLNAESVRAQAGHTVDRADPIHREVAGGWLLIPPKRGRLVSMPATAPFEHVLEYELVAEPGQYYDGPKHTADAAAVFVFSASDRTRAERTLTDLGAWLEHEWQWEIDE